MALFDYAGFDQAGGRVSGVVEAESAQQARGKLKQQGVLIKKIEEQSVAGTSLFGRSKVSLADVEFLTSELSLLLASGLKIDKGIELLKRSNNKPGLGMLLDKVARELRSGKQLSQALANFPEVFDALYINLVSIGEATGKLAGVFSQLAEDLAFRRDLQQKIIQALTYPLVILFVCLVSIIFIFNYVVPNMSSLFAGQNNLPLYTSMLLVASDWLVKYQFGLLAVIVVMAMLIYSNRNQPGLQKAWQELAIRLPVFSSAIILVERIRFNSGLAMMLHAGVAIDAALQLASGNIKHTHIRREVVIAINKVKRGDNLAASLRQTRLFPDFFASLLAVGEESGELAKIFQEIAQRSQRAFANWVGRLTSLIEPLLIIVMGGIVGGVVVIMMLSITSVTDVGF